MNSKLLQLSFELSGQVGSASYVHDAIDFLAELLPGESIGRYQIDIASSICLLVSTPPEHSNPEIADRLLAVAPEHPTLHSLRARPTDLSPRRMSDLLPTRRWRNTTVYREVFAPMNVEHNLSFLSRPPSSGLLAGWSFSRQRIDFDDSELELAAGLQPVMAALDQLHASLLEPTEPAAVEDARQRLQLSERELDVLELLARGMSADQIGRLRRISSRTVRKHLQNLYAKLGVHDRLLAVHKAREAGLIGQTPKPGSIVR